MTCVRQQFGGLEMRLHRLKRGSINGGEYVDACIGDCFNEHDPGLASVKLEELLKVENKRLSTPHSWLGRLSYGFVLGKVLKTCQASILTYKMTFLPM